LFAPLTITPKGTEGFVCVRRQRCRDGSSQGENKPLLCVYLQRREALASCVS
jgi:hypothetical protein